MPAGIIFRVGGALDPSYRTALAQSVAEAKAAAISINRTSIGGDSVNSAVAISSARGRKEVEVLRKQQRDLKVLQLSLIASSARASSDKFKVADAIAKKGAEIEVIYAKDAALKIAQISYDAGLALSVSQVALMRESQIAQTAIVATQTAEQVAIVEAGQMAEAEAIISASVAEKAAGHGNITGKVRETLVILREIAMGRGGPRVAGSMTLEAQYFGLLGLAVKSSAKEQVVAYAAAQKLNLQLALQAVAAKGTAGASAALAASQAQAALTAEALTAKMRALAVATVTLNPVFFAVVGAMVAVGAAAFFLWRHFRQAAIEAKNLADALNPLKQKFTELAEAEEKAAKARQEHADRMQEILDSHKTESALLAQKIKLLKEEREARKKTMEARGADNAELQAFDRQSLEMEKQLLLAEQERLTTLRDKAKADSDAAAEAAATGASLTDDKGRVIDLVQANAKTKRLGEIADAAQAALDAAPRKMVNTGETGMGPNGMSFPIYGSRAADANDPLKFKVDGKDFSMTQAEALANYNKAKADSKKLEADQAHLDAVMKSSESTVKDKQDALTTVASDLDEINSKIKSNITDPAIKREHERNSATERERVGIGAPQVANLQKQTLDVSKLQLAEMVKMNQYWNDAQKSRRSLLDEDRDGWS